MRYSVAGVLSYILLTLYSLSGTDVTYLALTVFDFTSGKKVFSKNNKQNKLVQERSFRLKLKCKLYFLGGYFKKICCTA
jgi:hypothetical protein